jgi:hypothetical protein
VTPNRDGIDESEFRVFGAWRWGVLPSVDTCGQTMEAAVRASRAPYVVYAEEHTYFREDWAERLVAAHEQGYEAVGFATKNANPNTLTSWAHLCGQFGPVVAPVKSRESDFLAGHHVSYSKELLLSYGKLLEPMLEDESALFLDLRVLGKKMFIAGDAISRRVSVSNLTTYIRMDYLGQRSFADARTTVGNWNRAKRVLTRARHPCFRG